MCYIHITNIISPILLKAVSLMQDTSHYNERKRRILNKCAKSVLTKLALCLIPGLFIFLAIVGYDWDESAEKGAGIFIISVAGIVAIIICYMAYVAICSAMHDIARLKTDCGITELPAVKLKRKILFVSIAGVIAIGILTIPISKSARISSIYSEGKELAAAGRYDEAIEFFEQIKDKNYKDSESLRNLCDAHVDYENGQILGAHFAMEKVDIDHISDEFAESASSFEVVVEAKYSEYLREEIKEDKKKEDERIKNGVPYVGMSETRIGDTSLGKPSKEVRHNTEMMHGEAYKANIYDFYEDGKRIFTARCVDGKVIQVWDKRDDPENGYVYGHGSSGKSYSTGPDVDEYSDAEEFYYWNIDDFYDYEDAENYYNEHKGK